MIYRLVRPLLFAMDAERAHNLAISFAESINRHPRVAAFIRWWSGVVDKPKEVVGLTFPNVVGLAAGMDKNGVAPAAWHAFGFGFVELGTVTPLPQPGNDKPRMFREVKNEAIINRMGFNNRGAFAMRHQLERDFKAGLRPPIPIGISVGKNRNTPIGNAASDFATAAEIVADYADFLSINISSPNTVGLRSLQTAESAGELTAKVVKVSLGKPVFVKLAPELDGDDLKAVLDACLSAGAAGIIATNTLAVGIDDDRPQGGLSGRPLRELARSRVAAIRQHVGDRPAIIGCGGIDDIDSAKAMLDAGADLIQLYTGLVYKGPFLPARIARGLAKAI
jgi:dihydroorotate dehydrogenase